MQWIRPKGSLLLGFWERYDPLLPLVMVLLGCSSQNCFDYFITLWTKQREEEWHYWVIESSNLEKCSTIGLLLNEIVSLLANLLGFLFLLAECNLMYCKYIRILVCCQQRINWLIIFRGKFDQRSWSRKVTWVSNNYILTLNLYLVIMLIINMVKTKFPIVRDNK